MRVSLLSTITALTEHTYWVVAPRPPAPPLRDAASASLRALCAYTRCPARSFHVSYISENNGRSLSRVSQLNPLARREVRVERTARAATVSAPQAGGSPYRRADNYQWRQAADRA